VANGTSCSDGNVCNGDETCQSGTCTAGAPRACVTSVRSGTLTSSGNGTVSATLSPAVNPATSFLIFQTRHNSGNPPDSTVRGQIASSTSVSFTRVTTATTAVTIQWYVVEYGSGVTVQRGEVSQSATTVNVTLPTPVGSVSRAFVTWSKTPASGETAFDTNDPIVGELTSTTNLQFRTNAAAAGHTIRWQVIEFTNAADINVQKGTTSLTGTALSTAVTLPTAVDVTKTFVLAGYRSAGSGSDIGARLLRAQLTNATTVTIDRSISGSPDDITEIVWQAVELRGASVVQRGTQNFPSASAQQVVTIASVDTSRSTPFASVQLVSGQNTGRSSYAGNDITGVASATMALSSPTTITMDRTSTAAAADIGWFVVQWP
jgi:hypothetical protein